MKKESLHKILHGDIRVCLTKFDNEEIDYVITSPPYWSQRDYGFKNQIGNEKSFKDYIANLVDVFGELRKKLKSKGNFFLNIGDKYINRYGNTPLGMIPYKLAYCMVKDGWILSDIIIWYKPNHMPSSVKNRFTNTYEPVFVFSKSKENYYEIKKERENSSSILKIPLQPVPYAHMATFPEKLIENLLELTELNQDSCVVDPFGGSGTTCKAVQNLNKRLKKNLRSFMIEAQDDFIKIIRERCQISDENTIEVKSIDYNFKPLENLFIEPNVFLNKIDVESKFLSNELKKTLYKTDSMIVLMIESEEDYEALIPLFFSDYFIDELADDGVIFLGLPDNDIDKIFAITNANKWIIRNMIIIPKENSWIPIFMLVKDTKMIKYSFSIEPIRVSHRTKIEEDWKNIDFSGYRVIKPNAFFKNELTGIITNVISKKDNGLPHWVVVKWEDETITEEEVINPPLPERKFKFFCPKCNTLLEKYYHSQKKCNCPNCNLELWKDVNFIPKLELNKRNEPIFDPKKIKYNIVEKDTTRNYNGKFQDAERINMGQSPGARSSVSEQYFTMQRYYKIKHGLFSDYLNLHRKKKNLSKNELTNLFPLEYKHTVGHWLRKDMGGSLPKIEDLLELNKILELDETYLLYASRMGIKLQSVIANIKGKNPGDFLELEITEFIKLLIKADES